MDRDVIRPFGQSLECKAAGSFGVGKRDGASIEIIIQEAYFDRQIVEMRIWDDEPSVETEGSGLCLHDSRAEHNGGQANASKKSNHVEVIRSMHRNPRISEFIA